MRDCYDEDYRDSINLAAMQITLLKSIAISEALAEQVVSYNNGISPTLSDMGRYGGHFVFPDGSEEYRWRGKTIVKVIPRKFPKWEVVKIPL